MARATKTVADEIAMRCVAARARLLSRVVSNLYDDALRPVGLTSAQMTILTALEHSGGAQPAQLCEVLMIDKSTLSRNADRMERNGWVKRESGPDARSHKLHLTDKGRKRLEQAVPQWRKAQAEAEALLGKPGLDSVVKVTKRLRGF
ncbi:MAG: winged helix-turn-helix transcriptional regulator [Planctomycetes bacterium]|nr:winged helix-turn-helix transcriptional regulator [Planctomycetota bacterium]